MSDRSVIVKAALAGVLIIAAVGFGIARYRSAMSTGEEGAQAYFYDLSEKTLYRVTRDTLPPHEGIGGTGGDGVRAVVVCPRDQQADPSKRRIAYLETYSPALRQKLETIKAARKAGHSSEVKGLSGVDPFVLKNTLVRREGEDRWHDMTTIEAQAVISTWRSWRDESGQPLVVVVP